MRIKNPLLIVCSACSIAGLVLIYIADINLAATQLRIGDIDFDMVGRKVATTGYIYYVRKHPEGHVFLTISDGKDKIQVPLFNGFVNTLQESGIGPAQLVKGKRIEVEGLVEEYQGSLQISPRTAEDIKIVGE